MLKTLTRYPTVLGASIFLLFGVVYAQVVSEEQPPETEEVVTADTSNVVIEEPESASSSESIIEQIATSTEEIVASTTEPVASSDIATTTTSTTTEPVATSTETVNELSIVTQAPVVFESVDDITKPSECREESALSFFKNIGECARYVIAKISEEKFEEVNSEEPKYEDPSGQ